MKNASRTLLRKLAIGFLVLVSYLLIAAQSRAGITFGLDFQITSDGYGNYYYAFDCFDTTTNSTAPAAPYGDYYFVSPFYPASNQVSAYFHYDTNGWGLQGGGYNLIYDFSDIMNRLTNGFWTLYFTNLNTTNVTIYNFRVTASGFTSNSVPASYVSFPTNGATITNRNPVFTFQGPTNFNSISIGLHNQNYSFNHGDSLPATQTSWPTPATIPLGTNFFSVSYFGTTTAFSTSTATNGSGAAISGWSAEYSLSSSYTSQFIIPSPPPTVGYTNMMHYTFDNPSYPGEDFSSNQFNINCTSYWGSPDDTSSTNGVSGDARQFYGNSSIDVGCSQTSTLNAWSNVFGGSFSVSAWINTSVVSGNDSDTGWYYEDPAVIFEEFNQQGTIPIGLTGTKVSFFTGDPDGNQDTLHSVTDVTTGQYVHVVVTRDASTGQKQIYINGALDASDTASTENLTANIVTYDQQGIGGVYGNAYSGLVDDVQIYSGILAASDVQYLYTHPGQLAMPLDFNAALGTTGLNWTTSGDSFWYIESTNTPGSAEAVESGIVTNNQASVLSVTVTGPGTLTFSWQSLANFPANFDLEFDIDGTYQDDIYFDTYWYQDGPFSIPSGQHTLSWTAYAYGDDDPTESGFLGMVSYTQFYPPVIALNPFNQTNYPGYPVGLIAAVTNTNDTSITWQWYKVGSGAITNATNAFFTPTNSGTASVAGGYYAIASNASGSAQTTTATVTFVSAPAPPTWATAFKSAFQSQDDSQVTQDFYFGSVVDNTGNIYAAAEFGGNMTVGSSNLDSGTGGDAAAIVKQTPGGSALWAVGITNNGNGDASGLCVALAPNNGVYFSGNYSGTNWLGSNQIVGPNGGIFVTRFDGNGNNLWLKTFGGASGSFMLENTMVSDPSGNVTLVGVFNSGPVTLGSSNYNISGQASILFHLDPTGTVLWSEQLPSEFAQCLAYGGGNVYVSFGSFVANGATNMVVGSVSNTTDRNWAIASVSDSSGSVNWIRGVGAQSGSGNGNPYATGSIDDCPLIAATTSQVFIVGVAYSSNAMFGSYTVNFGDLRGQYVAKYDTNGNALGATTFGSVTTTPRAVVTGNSSVYVAGQFDTYSFFGQDMIAAPRNAVQYPGDFTQGFLAKFDQNGNALWADMAVSPAFVNLLGVALATNGVWASGICQSSNAPGISAATAFGTNNVYSDVQFLNGGSGGGVFALFHDAGVLAFVNDASTQIPPVMLTNVMVSGLNFQFSFISTPAHTNFVQYSTNLAADVWLPYTNYVGDGTLKTVVVPASSPSQKYFRVSTE